MSRYSRRSLTTISIHAPRTGSDSPVTVLYSVSRYFNPRSPHGERLYAQQMIRAHKSHFNPRSPHGERQSASTFQSVQRYFNPRSPHGERPTAASTASSALDFNPRSPHGERQKRMCRMHTPKRFQSTLPARGATAILVDLQAHRRKFQSTLPARGAT